MEYVFRDLFLRKLVSFIISNFTSTSTKVVKREYSCLTYICLTNISIDEKIIIDQILFYFHKASDLNGIQITRTQHLMSQIKALSFLFGLK